MRAPAKPLIYLARLARRRVEFACFIAQIAQLTCVSFDPDSRKRGLMMTHTILRLPAVKASTGLSRSTIYLRVSQGTFPKPVSLGGRAVGWLEAEIQEWLQRRIEASRKAAA
jgi:prophage regulatory protein